MILLVLTIISLCYVLCQGIKELRLNGIAADLGKPVYNSQVHSNQHMVMLLFIIFYTIVNVMAAGYFLSVLNVEFNIKLYIFLKFNILNIIWLIAIGHFKQERLNKTKPVTFKNWFKF